MCLFYTRSKLLYSSIYFHKAMKKDNTSWRYILKIYIFRVIIYDCWFLFWSVITSKMWLCYELLFADGEVRVAYHKKNNHHGEDNFFNIFIIYLNWIIYIVDVKKSSLYHLQYLISYYLVGLKVKRNCKYRDLNFSDVGQHLHRPNSATPNYGCSYTLQVQ